MTAAAPPPAAVVKIGGAAVGAGADPALQDVAGLVAAGLRLAVVHGGGPEISAWCRRLGIEPRFAGGRRITDADTADVAEMVLAGRVGRALAAAFTALGTPALSLTGKDAGLFGAVPLGADLGRVGRVGPVRPAVLHALWSAGLLPLVAPIGAGPDGGTLNVNGDDAASDLAVALHAPVLVLASDVPGVLVDGRPLPACGLAEAEALIARGVVAGGMVAKVRACLRAVAGGVGSAVIVDGGVPGAVAAAVRGQSAAGTAFAAA